MKARPKREDFVKQEPLQVLGVVPTDYSGYIKALEQWAEEAESVISKITYANNANKEALERVAQENEKLRDLLHKSHVRGITSEKHDKEVKQALKQNENEQ